MCWVPGTRLPTAPISRIPEPGREARGNDGASAGVSAELDGRIQLFTIILVEMFLVFRS